MAASSYSAYPELGPSGAVPTPRHPYFGLGDDGLGDEGLDEDFRSSSSEDSITYDEPDDMEVAEDDEQQSHSDYDEDEDADFLQEIPFLGIAELDANTLSVDKTFSPQSGPSEDASDNDSMDSAVRQGGQGEGRRGASRGRGRGRGHGRGRGRGRGRDRGRGERGETQEDASRARTKGKRGPRAPAEPSREFKDLQAKATSAFLEKSYEAALEYVKQAVQINPEIFAAHSLMSEIYLEMGMKEESVGVLWSGAHTKREPGVWYEVRNRILQLEAADEEQTRKQLLYCYSQILRLDPNEIEARQERMGIFVELDHKPRAIRDCLALIKLSPHDLDLLQLLADLCIKAGEPAKAKEAYDTALKHYQSVQSDGFGGEFTFSNLNIYLELFVDMKDWSGGLLALKSIARWLCGRGDEEFWDECQENDCEWDLEDEPRRIEVNGFEPGVHDMDAYGEALVNVPEIRSKLGLFRLYLGPKHYDEAMHHFEFLDTEDTSPEAYVYEYRDLFVEIGDALRLHSLASEALRFYGAVERTVSTIDTLLRSNIGDCHRQLAQWRLAAEYFESVVEDDPQNIEARVDLAKVYEELGDSVKAFEHVSFAIKVRRANAIAAVVQDSTLSTSERAVLALPDPVEEAEIPATSTSVHLLLNKLVASMPKKHPNRDAKTIERHRASAADTKEMYAQMITLLPHMRSGDKEAEKGWMKLAEKMMEAFKSAKVFFPQERYIKFLGYTAEAKRRAAKKPGEALTEIEAIADRLQIALGEDINFDEDPQYIPNDYHGLLFTEWLDIYCEYAVQAARNADSKTSYATLTAALEPNVFYHNEEAIFHIHVCWFACALMLEDDERLCMVARWFWKQYPFATDTFRLFAALNRLHHGESTWYNAGPTQKYVLRAIKHMDFALLSEENRAGNKFSSLERASSFSTLPTSDAATPGNPHGLTSLDPALLTLYGHILAAATSYPNALNYYFRAYAVDPTNTLVVFSIAVAYLQNSIKRQSDNRHYQALQGVAFFNKYKELRLKTANSMAGVQGIRIKQEIDFNEGRMWHMLGLMHLAVAGYERCLASDETEASAVPAQNENDVHMTDADDDWVAVDAAEEERKPTPVIEEQDYKREAAFALQTIYALGGDLHKARDIAEKWLVF